MKNYKTEEKTGGLVKFSWLPIGVVNRQTSAFLELDKPELSGGGGHRQQACPLPPQPPRLPRRELGRWNTRKNLAGNF